MALRFTKYLALSTTIREHNQSDRTGHERHSMSLRAERLTRHLLTAATTIITTGIGLFFLVVLVGYATGILT